MLHIKLTKSILHTTDNYIKALEKVGVTTVEDLLLHYPREYDDRTEVLDSFSLVNIKEKNTILVKLLSVNNIKTSNNKILTKAVLEDKSGFMSEAVWFNRKYLSTQMKASVGKKVLVSGKVKYAFGKITFQSPDIESDLSKIGGEIVPVYSDLNYIPTKWIAPKIKLLKNYISDFEETLPEKIIEKYNFLSKKESIYKIHFPKNQHDIDQAKYRLAYDELFEINYKAISKKYEKIGESEGKSIATVLNVDLIKKIISELPFELTGKQKIVLFQILKDMEKTHSMARLLEGDVGTGKTIVALISAIHMILENKKTSPLAPENKKTSPLAPENTLAPENKKTSPLAPLLQERGIEHMGVIENYRSVPDYVKDLARDLREKQTNSEEILWEILRNRKLNGLKFRRQHPFGRYIADFYCHEIGLVIELDGKIHEKTIEYDKIRDEIISKYGVQILRITNQELENNIKTTIEKIINPPSPAGEGARGGGLISTGDVSRGGGLISTGDVSRGGGLISAGDVSMGGDLIPKGDVSMGGGSIQVVIMAPTEILARQHFNSSQEMLLQYGISSHLLVGSTTKKQKLLVKSDMKTGNVDIVFGTHALVQEDVLFYNLGYVIIDEQHRFGVKQREILESGLGNRSGIIPHSLNMTATPIPRTLALTLYGDQDLSVINEYPKGRKPIYTKVINGDEGRYQVELFIRSELEKGRQVFWVSPLVEASEKMDLANAHDTFEHLIDAFSGYQVGLLHGKMKPKEKEAIMKDFKENKIQVLSSTSVIEVGVDVPNSTIMCIEGAERFGLSQLHQFRGRVGRGANQSYCYLFPTKGNKTDRLKAMERTNNGFELAEIDLEIRGPGEVYGIKQSGVPDLKIAELTDLDLISQIREDIQAELFGKNKREHPGVEELFEKKKK